MRAVLYHLYHAILYVSELCRSYLHFSAFCSHLSLPLSVCRTTSITSISLFDLEPDKSTIFDILHPVYHKHTPLQAVAQLPASLFLHMLVVCCTLHVAFRLGLDLVPVSDLSVSQGLTTICSSIITCLGSLEPTLSAAGAGLV